MHFLGHEGKNGLGILERLRGARGARVLPVVGQFLTPSEVTDGVTEERRAEGRSLLAGKEGKQWVARWRVTTQVRIHSTCLVHYCYVIRIPVDNRSPTSCHHGPYATFRIQHCQLQRGSTLCIQICNIRLLHTHTHRQTRTHTHTHTHAHTRTCAHTHTHTHKGEH